YKFVRPTEAGRHDDQDVPEPSVAERIATDVPDESTRAAIRALAQRVEDEDGAPPLSDQALTRLGSPAVVHATVRLDGALVGYAQRDGAGAE
ncbi:hypothetical protein ADUPG1_004850, partial [Aduncisulcus paluster]